MTAPESASRKPKQLEAGSFQPEISSFRLHLVAEGKAGKTVRPEPGGKAGPYWHDRVFDCRVFFPPVGARFVPERSVT